MTRGIERTFSRPFSETFRISKNEDFNGSYLENKNEFLKNSFETVFRASKSCDRGQLVSAFQLTFNRSIISIIEPVFVIQKSIMKVITFNEMIVHSTSIFDGLKILRLNDVFQLQLVCFVYKCINNLSPLYFRNYFIVISSAHSIGTCQSKRGDLFVEGKNTTEYGIRSIHFSGARP